MNSIWAEVCIKSAPNNLNEPSTFFVWADQAVFGNTETAVQKLKYATFEGGVSTFLGEKTLNSWNNNFWLKFDSRKRYIFFSVQFHIQAFLNFRGFDFHDFRFTTVYNSILFSSPLVLLSNLDLHGFCFCAITFVSPH